MAAAQAGRGRRARGGGRRRSCRELSATLTSLPPLPIDVVLDDIAAAHERRGAVVIEATPGAGKTTRVPPKIAGRARSVVVLEPRRIAARLAAARVAEELGESVGNTVGHQVRFDVQKSAATRVLFMTEGVLTRRIMQDRELAGVDTVIVDEVHERHVHTDLALALVDRLRRTTRPDLGLVIMSATLDGARFAERYDAALVRSGERLHEVAISYVPSREALDVQVAAAVRQLCRDGLDGHVLVFLPGVREIRMAAERCRGVARRYDLDVLPLHGRLPAREQDLAVAPSSRNKVVLATNVAESSITIPGIAAVIDSGLVRTPRHHPWASAPTLQTVFISRASAEQRAGRAGRTRAGRCVRLYGARDLERAPAFDPPEIERADLAELVLAVAAAGALHDELRWMSPPRGDAWAAANELLERLGAVDHGITDIGREMLRFAAHPRFSRALVEAERRGVGDAIAQVAAVAADGRGEAVNIWQRVEGIDRDRSAKRTFAQFRRALRKGSPPDDVDAEIGAAMLAGFGDRLAKRVGDGELALADGGKASLGAAPGIGDFLVVLSAMAYERSISRVRLALPLALDDVLEALIDHIEDERVYEYSSERRRVEVLRRLRFRSLTLEEERRRAEPGEEPARVLCDALWRAGLHRSDEMETLRARLAWIDAPLSDDTLRDKLAALCVTAVSAAEIEAMDLPAVLTGMLEAGVRKRLGKNAPKRVRLENGVELPVRYPVGREPYVESYMQDFFGLSEGPTLGKPLLLHLWAPNRRAEQVTHDLASFWREHYPSMHKRLSRRYPKHHWPTEPRTAKPVRLKRYVEPHRS